MLRTAVRVTRKVRSPPSTTLLIKKRVDLDENISLPLHKFIFNLTIVLQLI